MVDQSTRTRSVLHWLISPGVLKTLAFAGALVVGVTYLTRLKAHEIAANNFAPVRMKWAHGTSDRRLQDAIDRNDGKAATALLKVVPSSDIRENIIDRIAFDKYSHVLEAFLKAGWDPNGQLKNGEPVLTASGWNQPLALQILLSHGAKADVTDDRDRSAMLWASASDDHGAEMVKLLASHGAQVDTISTLHQQSHFTEPFVLRIRPLAVAAERGNVAAVASLLGLGANAHSVSGEDLPPIVAASLSRKPVVTRLLISHGADVNAAGIVNIGPRMGPQVLVTATALYFNAKFDVPDTVRMLLDHGADPGTAGSTSQTPVEVATGKSKLILQSLPRR